ncbi:MAG: glycoside hydrolase family 13 protein [Candidatus Limiplasma sp.]|nr:glycoside hydrolase family 13 protein [Candidatus Limiplasma sp.]
MKQLSLGSIYHMPWLEYRHATPDGDIVLRLRTGRGDFDRVAVRIANHYNFPDPFAQGQTLTMDVAFRDDLYDFYEIVFPLKDPRFKYLFLLYADGGRVFKLDGSGLRAGENTFDDISECFAFAYAYPAAPMPAWARGCVGYQIFPDRFRRAGEAEAGLEPWDSHRVQSEFRFGGNLNGIREAILYLKELGVDMVYTTPIFLSDSAHRYNTFDYYQVDPLLGTEAELKALCDELHKNGMRLVLDGVFNHSGLGFAPFVDAQQKGRDSAYYDWFFFDDVEACGYRTFSHEPYMPKLNLQNEACADYFLAVGEYWLKACGIDGWRLDVSPEVWPDFWRKYHSMMKRVNPDSLMIAECWDDSREWLTAGDMFDSTMHYVLSRNLWKRFCQRSITPAEFDAAVNGAAMLYPQRVQDVLWTFLGSHDTQRVLTRAGGDRRMLKAAAFFQFTFMGVPIIYYGDELAMEGGADPDNRRPMRWDDVEGNPMRRHFKKLAKLRKAHPALRVGAFHTWHVGADGLYAYERFTKEERVLCVLNTGVEDVTLQLPLPEPMRSQAAVRDLYGEHSLPVWSGFVEVKLSAGEGMVLK